MPGFRDLTGQKFNKLTAVSVAGKSKQGKYMWHCKCDCGGESIVNTTNLTGGAVLSCGKCPVNEYREENGYMIGYTSNNEPFFFDKEDFELVSSYNWWMDDGGYLRTMKNRKTIKLHRLIMNPPHDKQVDHRNGKQNDCRRFNMRICNNTQNSYNRKKQSGTTSRYKGVTWHGLSNKWQAEIRVNKKDIYLGIFSKEIDAAKAYDGAAIKHFGEFAWLNFPKHEVAI